MDGRVSKTRTPRSHVKLSKASQEKLLHAVASTAAEPRRRSARLRARQHSTDSGDPAGIVPPTPSREPQINTSAGLVPLPSERAGLPWTNAQSGLEREEVEQAAKTVQSKPSKRPYTSSLEPKVDGPAQASPATPLQKRQVEVDSDDKEHQPKRARLTRKNLALFNEMGKKKGNNKASASAPPNSAVESSTTKTTSTTTSGFAIQARDNGILDTRSSKPPENLEDIRKRLARSRATASPPESRFQHYVNRVEGACNEATMVVEVSEHMLKQYDDKRYKRAFNQAFTGFPKDVGFNNGLSAPQPDFIEGLEMEEYRPFPVDKQIGGAVLYKDDPYSMTLPHLVGEWKGRGKDMEEARLQSAYDGAALVYARNQALSYIGKPDPPGRAEVTTFTTDGTNLNMFAHYATPSEDGVLEYHQYPVTSANVKKSYQEFKDGRRELRNEQDHARKKSYALRDQLKEHWKQRGGGLHPIAEGAPPPIPGGTFGATTTYEDGSGYVIAEQPCQPTPAASSEPRKASSSQSLPPADDYIPGNGGQKRKASLSRGSSDGSSNGSSRQKSKYKSYWKRDAKSGRYFHKHSDGGVTWLDDDDDDDGTGPWA
ncbi:Uncharacterized protein TPAR_06803 [Tolypocladium paradoxum]|uniref:DUF7924 domain-containing protein n=1 Tax=Tolypocladium paradoxum TaxID=94208 RepID=A0A2S4KS40_9HYPO|nr:Uncharacterized protein TPAR_06803 [Tolypocladium paradoxum]